MIYSFTSIMFCTDNKCSQQSISHEHLQNSIEFQFLEEFNFENYRREF